MDLQHIDICAQPLDALLYRVEDVFARQADLVDEVAVIGRHVCDSERWIFFVDTEVALGQENDL